jgi:hypothetical protein
MRIRCETEALKNQNLASRLAKTYQDKTSQISVLDAQAADFMLGSLICAACIQRLECVFKHSVALNYYSSDNC